MNNTFQGWFTFSSRVTGLVHFCLHFLSVQHHDAAHYSAFKKKNWYLEPQPRCASLVPRTRCRGGFCVTRWSSSLTKATKVEHDCNKAQLGGTMQIDVTYIQSSSLGCFPVSFFFFLMVPYVLNNKSQQTDSDYTLEKGWPRRLWTPHPRRRSRPGWMWLRAAWSSSWWPCT